MLVYCGQTVGWIKMKLFGTQVELGLELGPGDDALDGDPYSPSKRGTAPSFRPMSIVAKRLEG